jgi:glycosyltransferase involved in cell wall biosynthesis
MKGDKKVLIIAYYWPPSGGSGVQRWLKFVKYLPQFGVTPYVFTPQNPAFAVKDESLSKNVPAEAKVIHFPIWEPYEAFFKLSTFFGGQKKSTKPNDLVSGKDKSLFHKISTWIRGNFFVPDPRIFWVRPSAKFLTDFIREHEIQTIVTTGPPHSMHLIGYRLKRTNPSLRWLADFRDPWSEWGFLDSLMVGAMAKKYHRRLESKVLTSADNIITVTPFFQRRFEFLSNKKVTLLTNGFDEDDFRNIVYKKGNKFLIRHVGIVNEKCDPRPFLTAVDRLMCAHDGFAANVAIEFIGEVHPRIMTFVYESKTLSPIITFRGNIPHKELIATYGESSLLLLILTGYKNAEGYLPGKVFEYLATGLPVMGVGPIPGDAASLLQETQAGIMCSSDDGDGIQKALLHAFDAWKNSPVPIVKNNNSFKYSRRGITQELVKLF